MFSSRPSNLNRPDVSIKPPDNAFAVGAARIGEYAPHEMILTMWIQAVKREVPITVTRPMVLVLC